MATSYVADPPIGTIFKFTESGTHYVMPKGRFSIKPGTVTLIFHKPIEPKEFGTREALMEKVKTAINSGLPQEYTS